MNILLILLGLLKIIGIIIGVIIALILLIVLIILLTPIKYYIELERYDNIKGNAEVKWLFGAVRFIVSITDDFNFKYSFRIFHKKFNSDDEIKENEKVSKTVETMEKKTEVKKETVKQEYKKTDSEKQNENIKPEKIEKPEKISEDKNTNTVKRVKVSDIENKIENTEKENKKPVNTEKEIEKTKPKKSKKVNKPKEKSIFEKIMDIPDKKEILKASIKLIKRLFKGVFPKNIFVDMEIGLGDPAMTGYVMGAYGAGKSYYGKSVNITPYFEGFKIQGIFKAKGRIIIGKLIFDILRFVFTKPVFNLIKNILKGNVI